MDFEKSLRIALEIIEQERAKKVSGLNPSEAAGYAMGLAFSAGVLKGLIKVVTPPTL